MTWEMLAAIGKLAAVLVGIPSLIYLAVQIREQTKLVDEIIARGDQPKAYSSYDLTVLRRKGTDLDR